MTTLYTLGLLELAPEQAAFVADFRGRHEPRYGTIVPAHFTLVFGTESIERAAYVEHVRSIASCAAPIEFVLRRVSIVHEAADGLFYVFLEPDQGAADLRALHEQLHRGAFARLPRRASPYAPHVTVATARERDEAERVCDELVAPSLEIRGVVRTLCVGTVGERVFDVVARAALLATSSS